MVIFKPLFCLEELQLANVIILSWIRSENVLLLPIYHFINIHVLVMRIHLHLFQLELEHLREFVTCVLITLIENEIGSKMENFKKSLLWKYMYKLRPSELAFD